MIAELKEGVQWVGVIDWSIRHFHGYELSTQRGTSYNAYLVFDEKIALVDTVWDVFRDEFIEQLRSAVDPAKIDYIIVNHSEPDHGGSLPDVLKLCPNAQLIISKRGADVIEGHHHRTWDWRTVQTGDRISLGRNELVFIEAPMLHWPDSMFTYVTGHNILMPNDAFGQHYATAFRFNDQVDQRELLWEAQKYYANILTPFSEQVLKKIDELLALNLPVDIIAPSHGVIWRKDPLQIVRQYQEWARQIPEKRAIVLFDTMWQGTRRMAEAVADGLVAEGVPTKLQYAAVSDRNDVIGDILTAKAIVVGSPTLNRGLLPSLTPILEELRGLKFKNKIGAAFGTYGWSGESVKLIEECFGMAKIPVVAEGVLTKWQPSADVLAKCRELGRTVAQAVKAG